jgi:hypothetical protein
MTSHSEGPVPIDHTRITDGFAELESHQFYQPLVTYCGICDHPITLSPLEQKYLLEQASVPVKMLRRGAAYCPECARRRARIKALRSGERWRTEHGGKEELSRLTAEETELKTKSAHRYLRADWPY